MMFFLGFCLLLTQVFQYSKSDKYTLNYRADFMSLYPIPVEEPRIVETKVHLRRVSRNQTSVFGYIEVFENTPPIWYKYNLKMKTESGEKNYVSDQFKFMSREVCSNEMLKNVMNYIGPFLAEDCSLKKGKYEIKNVDPNEVMHKRTNVSLIGKFGTEWLLMDQDENTYFGYNSEINIFNEQINAPKLL